jgi:hypothetical protein
VRSFTASSEKKRDESRCSLSRDASVRESRPSLPAAFFTAVSNSRLHASAKALGVGAVFKMGAMGRNMHRRRRAMK